MKKYFQQFLFITTIVFIELFFVQPGTIANAANSEDAYFEAMMNPKNRDPKKQTELKQKALGENFQSIKTEAAELRKETEAPDLQSKPSHSKNSNDSETAKGPLPPSRLNLSEDEVPKEILFPEESPAPIKKAVQKQ